MKLIYFARLREQTGLDSEDIAINDTITTVAQLIDFLKSRNDAFALAFADTSHLHVAIDQDHANLDSSIVGAREIAFFPPMTGG